jgi:hypothetical protein
MGEKLNFNIELLYAALDEKRESVGLTWSGVAKEIEERFARVSASTIKNMTGKQFVEGDGVLQMLLWLGQPPEHFVPSCEVNSSHELREPQGGVIRFDLPKTYLLMDQKREAKGLDWNEVAEQIGGFSAGELQRYMNGGRTSFPGIMRISMWLGLPAAELTRISPW